MARFVSSMNVSLDGYVDHDRMAPDADVFRHWTLAVKRTPNSLYGRKTYDLMRYWEPDQPDWDDARREFAAAWRAQKKWVVSQTLTEVGPNATLISSDIEATVRSLKDRLPGQVDVSGTILAQSLADWGLMDEYQLVLHPVALGSGKPFFAGPRPPMQLSGSDRIGATVICLTYTVT
ncbi:dihydrofolate reductase family protein [Tabrizicola sp.]|uniref:dihydrofolate reductase family protein n=1 Tax=Tabrizicola sp. TaxID=2005166 RepID=UPI001A53F12B|nr:dihydrofolate reductase family protein [Tabrizicola sp.]MBL9074934.1 dihydrofolate reductase family protein [Tabrizicola sp.]